MASTHSTCDLDPFKRHNEAMFTDLYWAILTLDSLGKPIQQGRKYEYNDQLKMSVR